MKKKLLKNLKVQSFVTTIKKTTAETVVGGTGFCLTNEECNTRIEGVSDCCTSTQQTEGNNCGH